MYIIILVWTEPIVCTPLIIAVSFQQAIRSNFNTHQLHLLTQCKISGSYYVNSHHHREEKSGTQLPSDILKFMERAEQRIFRAESTPLESCSSAAQHRIARYMFRWITLRYVLSRITKKSNDPHAALHRAKQQRIWIHTVRLLVQ
jgi:hypothetical protein